MEHFRLYHWGRDGHIARADTLQCQDDEEAIRVAGGRDNPYGMELWRRGFLLKRFEPQGASAA
jgi:hypothetical protein